MENFKKLEKSRNVKNWEIEKFLKIWKLQKYGKIEKLGTLKLKKFKLIQEF